ncbi:AIG2-like protein A isoform X1 [Brassica rapa]|uniref:AIG2-like protein A isoform X1 n=1 Tax=Brassica campestris TaxID=3711 RepID=UPI00142D3E7A|nr:AIG2-like protein A isoform X1 [Brassica rapa]
MSGSGTQLHNVFVYGSFQEPEVVKVMLDRTPEIISVTLPGFKRFRLKGRLYPCIVPSEAGEVHGKVLMGLTDKELSNLDAVEGNEYEKVTVEVVRKENSAKMIVKTYIWINKNDPDMYGEWDFEEWKQLHMPKFMETIKEIIEINKNHQGKGVEDYTQILHKNLGDAPLS